MMIRAVYAVIFFLLITLYFLVSPSSTWFNSLHGINPKIHQDYTIEIFDNFIRRVDNIVADGQGGLFVTLEKGHLEGQVLHITETGHREIVIDYLDRPDGLRLNKNRLFVVEEIQNGRLIVYDLSTKKSKILARFNRPEGLAVLDDGRILVAEDKEQGSILELSENGDVVTILSGLNRPEAVVQDSNGIIYFTETGSGTVSKLQNGNVSIVAKNLNHPDQLEIDNDGVLWIGEDCKNAKLYRLEGNKLEVVAENLFYIQGIETSLEGDVYIAEQGRNRVLIIHKI